MPSSFSKQDQQTGKDQQEIEIKFLWLKITVKNPTNITIDLLRLLFKYFIYLLMLLLLIHFL